MEDEFDFEDLPVITIALYDSFPRVDLGTVNPLVAISLFELIIDALKDVVGSPSIIYQGHEIYDDFPDNEKEN